MLTNYKNPLLFYVLATVIPWVCWFYAGYLSYHPKPTDNYPLFISFVSFLGLCVPVFIAIYFMKNNASLRSDIFSRIFTLRGITTKYFLLTIGLMPLSILMAMGISVLFGYSAEQFLLADQFSFSSGVFPVWLLLIVAPLIEELGWHSYATDCLRNRFNLLNTCLIFSLFWGVWHIPLSSIQDYYHSNVVETGWLHGLNFLVSIFPFVIIMNWLYYKTNRNIMVTIIFHITAGYFNEVFATHPDSKLIQTVILIFASILLILWDKDFFTNQEYIEK